MHQVVQIVPFLPGTPHGISDYAERLGAELERAHRIHSRFIAPSYSASRLLASSLPEPSKVESEAALTLEGLSELLPRGTRAVVVHFGARAYPLVRILRSLKKRWPFNFVVMCHETGAPLQVRDYSRDWLRLALPNRHPQRLGLLKALATIADTLFVPTSHHLARFKSPQLVRPIVLPCFSNVGELEVARPLAGRQRRAVVFGGAGTRRIFYRRSEALLAACQRLGIQQLVDIGPRSDQTGSVELPTSSAIRIVRAGSLETAAVGRILADSQVGWFDYSERSMGSLGKSGVFAAYAAHGMLPLSAVHDPSEGDGVHQGTHYLVPEQLPEAGSMEALQPIADQAHRWYRPHGLARCAELYAGAITGTTRPRELKAGAGAHDRLTSAAT